MTTMEQIEFTPHRRDAAAAQLAGAMLLLARRHAAALPAERSNDVDRAVAAALREFPDARRVLAQAVRRVDAMPKDRKAALFGDEHALRPVSQPLELSDLRGLFGRLSPVDPGDLRPTRGRYQLAFSHMICDDESNPEFALADQPYTVFALMTQADADAGRAATTVTTPIYDKVDDGERRPETGSQNLALFGPAQLGDGLVVIASQFEHDAGGDPAEIAKAVAVGLTIAAAAAKLLDKPIVSGVLGALGLIAGFLAGVLEDDPVGEPVAIALTSTSAAEATANGPTTMPAVVFNGGDANGSYRVFLTLRRS